MAADMIGTCRFCVFAELLQYADGHFSIRCTHPNADPATTRDVVLLDCCPGSKPSKARRASKNTGISN